MERGSPLPAVRSVFYTLSSPNVIFNNADLSRQREPRKIDHVILSAQLSACSKSMFPLLRRLAQNVCVWFLYLPQVCSAACAGVSQHYSTIISVYSSSTFRIKGLCLLSSRGAQNNRGKAGGACFCWW